MTDEMDTGPITHAEARQIAERYNASHWSRSRPIPDKEVARYTIPADPKRDDDIRLYAYIDQQEAERDRVLDEVLAAFEKLAPETKLRVGFVCGVVRTMKKQREALRGDAK